MRWPFWLVTITAISLATAHSLGGLGRGARPDPRLLPAGEVDPAITTSNILPEDYVGPGACLKCHAKESADWQGHAHRRMNQNPGPASVAGDFSGAVLETHNGRVVFQREGERHTIDVEAGGRPLRKYLVTRTVGSRVEQFYIGKQLTGPEPADDPAWSTLYGEHMLPFVYSFRLSRWLPKAYFDPDGPDELADGKLLVEGVDRIRDLRPYAMICMNCHNTYPYAYRVFRPHFAGFPHVQLQGEIGCLAGRVSPTIPVQPTLFAFERLNERLDPDRHLVTLGISCESCHFGCREHVEDPTKLPRYEPTSPLVRLAARGDTGTPSGRRPSAGGGRADPATINGVCAQCHAGPAHMFPNGSATSNSREALDMLSGHCVSEMSCLHCHDPHKSEGAAGREEKPKSAAACVGCHSKYADESTAATHSRHSAGAGLSCLDCHMPRYSQGLDELVRTHRVSQPVEPAMAAAGSANACNACHLDKSMRWTLDALEQGWGRVIRPDPSWQVHYGPRLERPVGESWLRGENTGMRLVAVAALSRSPLAQARRAEIFAALNDAEPINRLFALFAVQRLTGRIPTREEIDITADPETRKNQIDALLRSPRD